MNKMIACLIMILFTQSLYAWPPTYGAEFVLTTSEIETTTHIFKNDPYNSPEKKTQLTMVEFIRAKCKAAKCVVVEVEGKYDKDYMVHFEDGFWIKYSFDPGCVEIMFKPSTLETIKQNESRINEYVFESGKSLNMHVPKGAGGHVNFGVRSIFENNTEAFLKYFVDYANHPDLTLGGLGYNIRNAPPLSVLKEENRTALNKIIKDFYAGKIKSVQEAARRIQNEVYISSYFAEWGAPEHYQAVGLKYVNQTDLNEKDAPMELRGIRAQSEAADFIKMAELIEARVAYLNKNVSSIIYNETKKKVYSKSEVKTRFKLYVEETGLAFKDYTSLLPADIQAVQFTDIENPTKTPQQKLKDLRRYFDLLSTSTAIQDKFVNLLSDPSLQSDPRCQAYQQYFRKMSEKNIQVQDVKSNSSVFSKVLTFLGITKSELADHTALSLKSDLFKKLHTKIEINLSQSVKSEIQMPEKNVLKNTKSSTSVILCKSLFH